MIAVTHTQTGAIERYVYSLYGVEMRGDESGNPFCYTGRRYDAETEQTAFWTDEYGVMVPLVVTVLVLIYWRRTKAEGLRAPSKSMPNQPALLIRPAPEAGPDEVLMDQARAARPPSTFRMVPVIQLDSSDNKKRARAAGSSG